VGAQDFDAVAYELQRQQLPRQQAEYAAIDAVLAGDLAPARAYIAQYGAGAASAFTRQRLLDRARSVAANEAEGDWWWIEPLSIASFVFPELAPVVTAVKVVATGRASPQLLIGATGMNGNGVDVWGAGEFGTGPSIPDDWGSGGPDINIPAGQDPFGGALDLGSVVSTVGGLAGASQGGGLMPVGAAGALGAGAVVAGGLGLRAMSQIVAGAILKLKQSLGGGGFLTASGIASFGARTWSALTSWAARNPGLSVISTLVGLGLTVEEAAHFLAWGATRKRKRHRRGISYRDMRTTRRTMSRVISMSHQLRVLCGGAPRVHHRRYYSPPHRRGRVSA